MSLNKKELSNKLFISLGIVHQLTDSFLTKQLAPHGINQSQFHVLTHFSRHKEQPCTISQLAQVMQMNQPGITKVINKLDEMGLIDIEKDAFDGRKKWITVNDKGLEKLAAAYESFAPRMAEMFADWNEQEMIQTLQQIDKLKNWLDNHR
ncbi:MarR family winged helix-turn-helix transcriptional regulator [Vibrio mangrovi]|uniref:HTH-type transcriptional regulator MhqR n=1 Tax=Vibrio mangrovi TaxID=474394 RepID=A0A1Y6INA7_9VIBR|nr:MarR family transcriptional regulator [Vibrio mangrovi]MDW6004076.1 MarR family transcriptional regulator [Vibrio mangrovi]SMR99126.1 HTH-type transcriptional regulator MhqR [Vibrio mangrovi]